MRNRNPIHLSAGGPVDREVLAASGGFAWWYADLLDEEGNGAVLIWSYGLPFLPGYEGAARLGTAPPAGDRPSLYLVTYRRGVEDLYVFQEHERGDCEWSADGTRWRFGRTEIRSEVHGGERRLRADFDCDLPGFDAPLTGSLWVDGPARVDDRDPGELASVHDWSPLTGPARGGFRLRHGRRRLEMEGRGYHDRNASPVRLSGLGIEHWVWGRVSAPDRELIYYLLWCENRRFVGLGMEIDERGQTRHLDDVQVVRHGRRRARYGMPFWQEIEIQAEGRPWLRVDHERCIDDGPFYLRFQTEATLPSGGRAHGSGELLRPARVDLPVVRSLVRMKVEHLNDANSMFLPLLTGPRRGRILRFARRLLTPRDDPPPPPPSGGLGGSFSTSRVSSG